MPTPSKPIALERLVYTMPEVARLVGCSVSSVRRWVYAHQVASVKVMGRRMVPASAVRALCQLEDASAPIHADAGA